MYNHDKEAIASLKRSVFYLEAAINDLKRGMKTADEAGNMRAAMHRDDAAYRLGLNLIKLNLALDYLTVALKAPL